MPIFEICCNSIQSGINAQLADANRIELCANHASGGTTPSYGTLKLFREKIYLPVNVLIRPRSGDFCYSESEYQEIIEDILMCKKLGYDGIVCGILKPDGNIDVTRTKNLVDISRPLSFTFHRAFDVSKDSSQSLEDIILTSADRILTSGMHKTAFEGKDVLASLIKQAKDRIIIMPGSGINDSNILALYESTRATEFHFSGSSSTDSVMSFKRQNIISTTEDDYKISTSDIEKIKRTINKLQ
ncbi:MAG: copper homeostasis protein CutC [Bacteroidales bacterium]|nr:copper homeostasis protein CutC [Bacteroidales bacterium]